MEDATKLITQLRQRHSLPAIAEAIKMDHRNVQRLASGASKGNPVTRQFLKVLLKCKEAREIVGL